jgi:hypothetical protein
MIGEYMSEVNPRNSDAILGGQNPPPLTGAILGGLAGAKQRLESETLVARLSALTDAFQYGEQGIELAIQALDDPDEQVQRLACRLLRSQDNALGRQAILNHRPLSYFTTLADWRFETYNAQVGVTDPENNAYVVRMTNSGRSGRSGESPVYDMSQFQALLQDQRVADVQALIFEMDYNYWDEENTFRIALEAIVAAKDTFPNLKALFVGDSEGDRAPEFKKSKVRVFDITPFLASFPQLEVLQVFGYFGEYEGYTLTCQDYRHENLKTLIVETSDITQENIEQICSIDLPALEYLELWFGREYEYVSAVPPLKSIFAGETYPNLKYLGLCSSEEIQTLIESIAPSALMQQLVVLDIKMGILTEAGIAPLCNPSLTSNLKILNVSGNDLSDAGLEKLIAQNYQVISTHQISPEYEYYDEEEETEDEESRYMNRRYALYE